MALPNPFKLEKLAIHVHRLINVSDSSKSKSTLVNTKDSKDQRWEFVDTLHVMFNPNSFSLSYGNKFRTPSSLDVQKKQAKPQQQQPDRLSLEFLIDGTGVTNFGIENMLGTKSVTERISELTQFGLDTEVESHVPHFLILEWGDLYFQCQMESMDVTFSLFDSVGKPLRAKVNATFVEATPPSNQARKNELHSSDITHARIVKMENTLPQLSKDIYGSYDHYAALARANDLDQFRRFEPGTELIFPPLEEII